MKLSESKTKYGKVRFGKLFKAPMVVTIEGQRVFDPTIEQLVSLGYRPVVENPPQCPKGYHLEAQYWVSQDEQSIVAEYTTVKDAARELSKRKLYRALVNANLWTAVETYMQQQGVTKDWEYATTLDEDDPLVVAAIEALVNAGALTDAQAADIIDASVA